ncbi:MAG: DEAH-box ATP-dependent RNA helicase prp43 [Watsoniomyces obsoletus]|nr:MAG: DEAH-box ATP-dependent RNA helicase prp43 [Watsoniomyces obsoletus]
MNAVDGSEHYDHYSDEPPPSLLTIVLDTNPLAWARLGDILPLSQAVANLLVFINAHLAFNYANQVAVIASHCNCTRWLYPTPSMEVIHGPRQQHDGDIEMVDVGDATVRSSTSKGRSGKDKPNQTTNDANKYRPFRQVEDDVMSNLRALIDATTSSDSNLNTRSNPTMMAGAMTLALAYINRQMTSYSENNGGTGTLNTAGDMLDPRDANASSNDIGTKGLQSRILVISVSNDVALQYIPIMNCIFAAQRKEP